MRNQQKMKDSMKSSTHKKKKSNKRRKHLKSVDCPEFTLQNVTLRGPDFASISKSISQYEKDGWYVVGTLHCFEALGYCKQTMQKKVYREEINNRFWKFKEQDYNY